jgi:signal transduction histidine kinase
MLDALNSFLQKRIEKHGAPYRSFGLFGLINYPLSYLFYLYGPTPGAYESLTLRLIASILCLALMLKDYWPNKLKKYLPTYWYFTIFYSIPLFGSYMLFCNHLSNAWLMNMVLGLFLFVLLVDWLMFIIMLILGVLGGFYISVLCGRMIEWPMVSLESVVMALYMYGFAIVIGGFFSRNHELINIERKRNLDYVKSLNVDLQNALSAKTEFLNNMSHEIRTPVQGFVGISDGLLHKWHLLSDDEKFNYIQIVASSGKRLGSLVNNLLDLSKFQVGKISLYPTAMDMDQAIKDIIDECETLYLTEKKIRIKYINEARNTNLNADEERLGQVLRNLFVNAIKFSNSGTELVATLRDTKLNGVPAIHFSLNDQGVGIPEDEVYAIFESFTQSTRTKTRAGGTGLGLAICKEIIDLHHGKIWAENNPDGGATFHFIIPCEQED